MAFGGHCSAFVARLCLRIGGWVILAICAGRLGISAEPTDHIGDAWHDSRNPIVKIFNGERLDLWSLKPIRSGDLPTTANSWSRTAVDPFIAVRLAAENLTPSAEADRRTLARRLFFDLTGLPPTPAEMTAFLASDAPDAYERLVDELLSRPSFGEHFARLWLDVVRYSDSNGFDWDEFRPQAWRFRDYVVRSLNADKPFDRFVTEQLAGDELLTGPPQTTADQDALLAVGYLCLGPRDNSAGLFNEQPRARAEWMFDLVDTTGSALLGLSFSCCRCHDHKYDPLSQADYFRLRAFFEPLEYADKTPINLAAEQAAIAKHNAELDKRSQPLQKAHEELRKKISQRLRDERIVKLTDEQRAALQAKDEGLEKQVTPADKEIEEARSDGEKKQEQQWAEQRTALEKQKRSLQYALLAADRGGNIPATRVLYQGDHQAEREEVVVGVLSVLDPNPLTITPPPNKNSQGRRLALAQWLTSRENPLTSRVFVNRVWQQLFGRGLVATPNDFGLAGTKPTHPELLDWLAADFSRTWSIKDLHRTLVGSATYRQGSTAALLAADPENQLHARHSLRRLSAEQLRDALLAVSGQLHPKQSGPPIWPELPADMLASNPAFLDDNAEKTKGWYPSSAAEQLGRSVFLVQKRNTRVPFLETFDLPENIVSCARRNRSVVAPQALTLLNSPLAVKIARGLAARVEQEAGEEPQLQIQALFALALQRPPSQAEQARCEELRARRGLVELCRALVNVNEFAYVD